MTPRLPLPAPVRQALGRLRQDPLSPRASLAGLVALTFVVLGLVFTVDAEIVAASSFVLPMLGGGLLLGRRPLSFLLALIAGCVLLDLLVGPDDNRYGTTVVLAITAAVVYEFARSREQTGLAGLRGDSVLVELRRRLEQQGALPALPAGWAAESVVRPAGGGPFSGDFVVSAMTGRRRLEVALADVSGKGVDAGTRSLLLSGAMGGLLGSTRPEDFLPAASAYLERQDWDEGFATAVHVTLDLGDGCYRVASAGHPPAALFDAGTGRWSLLTAEGPALGLLPDADYAPSTGRLDRGDALLLYTDGLVEVSGRDLEVGIDKLLGEAERLVPRGFAGGAEVLASRVADSSADDRGLVLIWRT